MPKINLLPGAVAEIMAATADTGSLSLADRYGLMAAILNESLAEEEIESINRLLRFVIKGRIKVTNDISTDV
ncbi:MULTISPECIES: hypothetical protein [unclassified Anabaena]|uniref:hypothetical protein n=1 Tax=unclassified Anabaena TaxID=2619674 RepID=UPI001445493C|nr:MULTISPECIES: hypothetical protein [unclassified Anabaena]MTJ06179.1 hypothetical protein [Anabaena sp. UHCC 0204]MTJ54730.1 hypothetical protein [Anabaena sp. UHCC 0253]